MAEKDNKRFRKVFYGIGEGVGVGGGRVKAITRTASAVKNSQKKVINVEMKEVTNVDRDCSPSNLFQVTPYPPHTLTLYPAFFPTIISLKSRVDVIIHLRQKKLKFFG